MKTEHLPLQALAPGTDASLTVHRFGQPDGHPSVYVQAALHAGEIPGMLVAHHLRNLLALLEAKGEITGEVMVVPSANPIGLAQKLLGQPIGRFNLADGKNFNRSYPHLGEEARESLAARLSADPAANVSFIRQALRDELAGWEPGNPAEFLKKTLLGLALGADLVLDLHCESEGVVHLYTHTRSKEAFAPLAALLEARAMLLADASGDDPFDEACSRPWAELADAFPGYPIPFSCHSATIELRGEADVSHDAAGGDARRLIDFLRLRGAIAGPAPTLPSPQCPPTPLAGSEPVRAPASGIIVFAAKAGDRVQAGDIVAEIVDPLTGVASQACASTDGVMFARVAVRFAIQGEPIAKIAGTKASRTGKLLTA